MSNVKYNTKHTYELKKIKKYYYHMFKYKKNHVWWREMKWKDIKRVAKETYYKEVNEKDEDKK